MTFLIAAENVAEVSDEATPEPPRKEWRPDQEAVVDPSDPEVQAAATRIQASCSNAGDLIHKSSKRIESSLSGWFQGDAGEAEVRRDEAGQEDHVGGRLWRRRRRERGGGT